MVLLTSTQVSTFVSAGVIVIFTFALFFAGYALQQDTVKNLREAVKPRPGFPILPSSLLAEPTPVVNLGSMREADRAQEQMILREEEEEDQIWSTPHSYSTNDGEGWTSDDGEKVKVEESASDRDEYLVPGASQFQKQNVLSSEADGEDDDRATTDTYVATEDGYWIAEDDYDAEMARKAYRHGEV